MSGRLTVCPTPIGNLEDLSPRARRALVEADLIACEDTRRTGLLYDRLGLERPRLVSYHDRNEAERAPAPAQQLERVLASPETVVAFESPRRLPDSLAALASLAADRPAVVCRELTKLHEEVVRGPLGELARRFRDGARGEIVVVIAPAERAPDRADFAFALDALRSLVASGARPRAAAGAARPRARAPPKDPPPRPPG